MQTTHNLLMADIFQTALRKSAAGQLFINVSSTEIFTDVTTTDTLQQGTEDNKKIDCMLCFTLNRIVKRGTIYK